MVIPMDKPFIFLRGAGRKRTFIVWGDHLSISQSPTFSMMADNFVARGISFMVIISKLLEFMIHSLSIYSVTCTAVDVYIKLITGH